MQGKIAKQVSCTVAIKTWTAMTFGTRPKNLFFSPSAALTSMILILHLTLGFIHRLYPLALSLLKSSSQSIVTVCGGVFRT